MDRLISKEEQRRARRKQGLKIGVVVGGIVIFVSICFSFFQASLYKKDLHLSVVDRGGIEVSVSASGKVVPAFE